MHGSYFDNVSAPCNIEKVKSRFIVMKNFYVYRKQFPLILAYANYHPRYLSNEAFSEGMAYVALSRVGSLDGLFHTAFDRQSISISVSSLQEVNRLRKTYRRGLSLNDIPRKLTGEDKNVALVQRRWSIPPTYGQDDSSIITATETPASSPFSLHSVDVQWQQSVCQQLGLQCTTETE